MQSQFTNATGTEKVQMEEPQKKFKSSKKKEDFKAINFESNHQ